MRKILTAILVFSFAFAPAAFAAEQAGNAPQKVYPGTKVMNAHGESMELEFRLYDPGDPNPIDYSKYGTFEGLGTEKYSYKVTDRKGLAAAVGEGIYPSNSIYKDPVYRLLLKKGRLGGTQWDYVNMANQQLTFYKWATSHDTPAVQQFYTAMALEKLGQWEHAVKAYQAVLVHFPKQIGWTFFRTPLYMGRLALDRIDFILRSHPELGLKIVDAEVTVDGGFNFDLTDDKFTVNPGRIVKVDPAELKHKKVDVSKLKVEKTIGTGATKIVLLENGHWQLRIDGKPAMVKAIAYAPTPVGKSPHSDGYDINGRWATEDANENGLADGPFDSWVDKNKNNEQDADEKAVGDFRLMKEMGVNTIRLYHHAPDKELLRKLYKDYGIRVIMGDMLGMYAAGSKAEWYAGTDYTNEEHKRNMRESVRTMVMEHKDEPYVLMWMLGNESNYGEVGNPDPKSMKEGFGSNAKHQPEEHYAFVNEVAGIIKELDPTRPVGFSNGEVVTINILAKHSSNIDVFGCNVYRGATGFGRSFWGDVKKHLDKPVLFTEYGCPAYMIGRDADTAEEKQMEYLKGNWEDMLWNSAGGPGTGAAIGGVQFEFVDEWWKSGVPPKFSATEQETVGIFAANFPDGWMHEEWLGLMSQGDGKHSPFKRQLRKAYHYFKKAWNS